MKALGAGRGGKYRAWVCGLHGESSVTPHLEALKRKGFVRVEGGVRGR